MTRKAKTNPDGPAAQMSDMMTQWQSMGLGALNMMGSGWAEAMADMGSEWLHFVSERVQKDVEFQHKLLHARTPQDVHAIQSAFFQSAVDDYSNGTGKMLELSAKLFEPPKK